MPKRSSLDIQKIILEILAKSSKPISLNKLRNIGITSWQTIIKNCEELHKREEIIMEKVENEKTKYLITITPRGEKTLFIISKNLKK